MSEPVKFGEISEAGVYQLDMDAYHGNPCVGPSLSSSGLAKILAQSPAHYWDESPLNPDRNFYEESKTLNFGKASHALTLGDPTFDAEFFVCPHDKLNANPGKQWHDGWKAAVAAGTEKRTLVKLYDFETIKLMAEEFKRSPQVGGAFKGGKPEQSFIWPVDVPNSDGETVKVWLKSRPDWTPADPKQSWLIDYKTAADLRQREFSLNAFKFNYHMQAAMQVDAVEAVMGIKPLGIAHVGQEKTPPYLAELRIFTPEQIMLGRIRYQRALQMFADCWTAHLAGKPMRVAWHGYTKEPQYFETPYHIAKEIEEAENDRSTSNQARSAAANDADAASYNLAG